MFKFEKDKIDKRIFIVGCSRSGTTLLQTLIASHPDITTFPETGFFFKTVGENPIKRVLAKIGISPDRKLFYLKNDIVKRLNTQIDHGKQSFLFNNNVKLFLSILDNVAIERGKKSWVEKTPLHIMNIDLIQKYVPNFKIIHMVRDGREVVASIYKRSLEYKETFGEQDIDYGVNLWNKAMMKSVKNFKREDNYLLKYEDLVADPLKQMNNIGRFLGIDFEEEYFRHRKKQFNNSIYKKENWKSNVIGKIENRNNKFMTIFDESQRKKIIGSLTKNPIYKYR